MEYQFNGILAILFRKKLWRNVNDMRKCSQYNT